MSLMSLMSFVSFVCFASLLQGRVFTQNPLQERQIPAGQTVRAGDSFVQLSLAALPLPRAAGFRELSCKLSDLGLETTSGDGQEMAARIM
jgi:hypothetical protein